jgi:acylglycerol lipase
MIVSRRRVLTALAGSLTVAGCASTFQPMGPLLVPPRMDDRELFMGDGARLPYRRWAPPEGMPVRAAILGLHGFNDYSNCFDEPAKTFSEQGIITYAYDQRGFGATRDLGIWAGTETMTADAAAALTLVRAAHPGVPLYLMGESMGGAVALVTLTTPPIPACDGAILVSPATWGFETMGFMPRITLQLAYATFPGMEVRPPQGMKIHPSDNIPMLIALSRDPLALKDTRVDALYGLTELMGSAYRAIPKLKGPSLTLYGRHEEVLPPEPVAAAVAEFDQRAGGRIAVYPDGYHMLLRDLHASVPTEDIIAWVGDHQGPLPSGDEKRPDGQIEAQAVPHPGSS